MASWTYDPSQYQEKNFELIGIGVEFFETFTSAFGAYRVGRRWASAYFIEFAQRVHTFCCAQRRSIVFKKT